MSAAPQLSSASSRSDDFEVTHPVDDGVAWVRGNDAILAQRPLLVLLAERHCLRGEMDDLAHLLETREAQRKHSHLLLLPQPEGPLCAVLLFEYRALTGLRVFSTADSTGRRNVLAPPGLRARIAAEAATVLLQGGAQVVHLSVAEGFRDSRHPTAVHHSPEHVRTCIAGVLGERRPGLPGGWSLQEQDIPLYLQLEPSMDATLATIGKKTRTNLRYYRRRAERDLGAHFVPQVNLSLDELLRFNRRCTFAVPDAVIRIRMQCYGRMWSPFFCGVRDGDGQWLSLAMGRRHHDVAELDWQMNRDDLPAASLSTVLRSFWIEHEIARGSRRLFLEGGTPSSLAYSFVRHPVHELTVKRASTYVRVLSRVGKRLAPRRNHLAQLLGRPDLRWRPLGQSPRDPGGPALV